MGSRHLDDIFAALAAAQEGLVGLDQARKLGYEPHQIRRRLESHRWHTVLRSVVRAAGSPVTWESDLMAATLLVGDRAVVARDGAARLLGLDRTPTVPAIEFVGKRGAGNALKGVVLSHTRKLDQVDIVIHRRPLPPSVRRDRTLRKAGLVTHYRSTSASRTIVDLAASVDEMRLAAMIDSACRLGHTSPQFLATRLAALRRGRAGTALVGAALTDAGGHSVLERTLLRALRRAELPRPRCQVTHSTTGGRIGRVDFDFSPLRLIVEVNGAKGHSSDPDRAKDARRRNELMLIGFVVLEFTYLQVMGETDRVVDQIASALATAALTPV